VFGITSTPAFIGRTLIQKQLRLRTQPAVGVILLRVVSSDEAIIVQVARRTNQADEITFHS
jgi:hypothetical protein